MSDLTGEARNRTIDRALLVAAFISFGFGMVAMISGLLR